VQRRGVSDLISEIGPKRVRISVQETGKEDQIIGILQPIMAAVELQFIVATLQAKRIREFHEKKFGYVGPNSGRMSKLILA